MPELQYATLMNDLFSLTFFRVLYQVVSCQHHPKKVNDEDDYSRPVGMFVKFVSVGRASKTFLH